MESARVAYRRVDCPNCGNTITAMGVTTKQKCPHCKRAYVINYIKRGKKSVWEPIAVDFDDDGKRKKFKKF